MLSVLWNVWNVHRSHTISTQMYGDWLILNLINWILYAAFSLKCLLRFRGGDHAWVVTYFIEKDSALSHVFRENLCIVTHLNLKLYSVLSTYSFVMQTLKWLPKQYMFYLNGLNVYLLLMMLHYWRKFLLPYLFEKETCLSKCFLTYCLLGHY